MSFQELAQITGKTVKAVQQAFYRKGFSIREPEDVQAYLHLTFRRHEVRKKRSYQSGDHLKNFRYRSKPRVGDVTDWLVAPRRMGQVTLDPTKEKLLPILVRSIFLASPKVYGVVCMGDWLRGGEGLYFLVVFSEQARRAAGERVKLIVSQMAESSGQDIRCTAVDLSALPATMEHESTGNIRTQLAAGRVEYGWVSLLAV